MLIFKIVVLFKIPPTNLFLMLKKKKEIFYFPNTRFDPCLKLFSGRSKSCKILIFSLL